MNLIKSIREYHDNPNNFNTMTIPGHLHDYPVYAILERKYAGFLKLIIEYFPFVLVCQWQQLYGMSRKSGYSAANELVKLHLVKEGNYTSQHGFKGLKFISPAPKSMMWFLKKDKVHAPFKTTTNNVLLDHFMRAEYFLKTGNLIATDASHFFAVHTNKEAELQLEQLKNEIKEKDKEHELLQAGVDSYSSRYAKAVLDKDQIEEMLDDAYELGKLEYQLDEILEPKRNTLEKTLNEVTRRKLPAVALGGIEILFEAWSERRIFKSTKPELNTEDDCLDLLLRCLSILPDRNCYFENIVTDESHVHFDLVLPHYHDSSPSRYHRLIEDVNMICNCFQGDNYFNLRLLCESEKDMHRAEEAIQIAFKQRRQKANPTTTKYTSRINFCHNVYFTNTNIARYFQKPDTDLLVDENDLMELELIIAELESR
jgi:hypothetical protein